MCCFFSYLDGKSTGVVYDSLSNPSDGLRRSGGSVTKYGEGRLVNSGLANPVNTPKTSFIQILPLNDHWTDRQALSNLPDELEKGNKTMIRLRDPDKSELRRHTSRKASVCISLQGVSTIFADISIPLATWLRHETSSSVRDLPSVQMNSTLTMWDDFSLSFGAELSDAVEFVFREY